MCFYAPVKQVIVSEAKAFTRSAQRTDPLYFSNISTMPGSSESG